MLYENCKSCICINGLLSKTFQIKRSVKQGCSLSMLLGVIYQDPLYRKINGNVNIILPNLPNNQKKVIQGYADDTYFFIATEDSVSEVYNEIVLFEKASGAKLNKSKTCIM